MVRDPLRYPDRDIIDTILDAYQRGDSELAALEKSITAFLLWGSAVQQLNAARSALSDLERLENEYDIKEKDA